MSAEAALAERKDSVVNAARILVVEDERIVARSLAKQLTTLGYEVVGTVSSGEEAIQQSWERRPDLVLMDISLDGPMDGVEAAAAIRKQFRLPVVYLTAYSTKEILERAKVTEPIGYILKPYDERELHVVIEMALYRHRMEQRQHERVQWFTATLKSIGDAVVATDDEGRITYMNPPAELLTGWSTRDALGQKMFDVIRPSTKTPGNPSFPRLARRCKKRRAPGILLVAKNSSEKPVETCVSLITDDKGHAVGKVAVLRDVTWRKQMEEQARQAKKLEAIGRLAGGMAHALNNLMTVALGNSDLMLRRMKSTDPLLPNAEAIRLSVARTVTLTQKLLAFGRKQFLALRRVDLNAMIGDLDIVVRQMLSGVRLDLILDPELGLAKADQDQLEEAILTLVRNACTAMPHGGQLTIQTANVEFGVNYAREHPNVRPGPYVLMAVTDTGIGMGQKEISHLFEPFHTTGACVGAGLALAAVYGFVKQSGGDIEVRSQPKHGTTFRIYLPRDAPISEVSIPST